MINKPVIFHTDDLPRLRRKYKAGTRMHVLVNNVDESQESKKVRKKFTVIKAYPFHVNCKEDHGYGHLRSFGYFELEQQATII